MLEILSLGYEILQTIFWHSSLPRFLFLAIVAAVALTLRRRKDSKYFDPAAAVKVKRNDRVRLVKMKAENLIALMALNNLQKNRCVNGIELDTFSDFGRDFVRDLSGRHLHESQKSSSFC